MRVLIYGGSFNPPHRGHEEALAAAAELLCPDEVLAIPAGIPPHKLLSEGSPSNEGRLVLSQLAFSDIPGVRVSDMEMLREGKSYTVDTLQQIAAERTGEELCFLMGTDSFLKIENWHDFLGILQICTLVVLPRNVGELPQIREHDRYLRNKYNASTVIIEKPPLPMASTELRELLPQRGGRELLSDEVYSEIIRHRYYGAKPELAWLREKAYAYLKPKRIPHVQGCEQECVRLAQRWGEDTDAAAEAGILHDITKKLSDEEQLRLCDEYGIILDTPERETPKILHARTGACVAREVFGVPDDIFSAIEWHTTGRVDMSRLEMIVYLADFIEPTRDFDGVKTVRRLAYEDLEQAMAAALEMSLEDVRSRGREPYHRTVETLQWLKAKG